MTPDEIREINDRLDKIHTDISDIKVCLLGYGGKEGLISRVRQHGDTIKYLTIAIIVLACAVLGIDAARGLM
jgi:hypothetical protein